MLGIGAVTNDNPFQLVIYALGACLTEMQRYLVGGLAYGLSYPLQVTGSSIVYFLHMVFPFCFGVKIAAKL